MDNNTTSAIFERTYPYVKTYWTDQSGHARYSLTTYHGAILTAFLAIILFYALGRLLFIATFILHFFLYRHSESERPKTVLDDQVNVIYANTQSPSTLLMYLLHLFKRRSYQAAHSKDWLLTFLVGLVFFVSQIVTVIWPGIILRSDPIPYSPGICGYPRHEGPTSTTWDFLRYERALLRYRECVDNGDHVTCPGPAGQAFSWEVFESEPGYCWFGQQYCFNGSTTITERATITPNDMGTLRKSPMSLTIMTECSHLNNTEFIEQGKSTAVYHLGTVTPEFENITLITFESWKVEPQKGYKVISFPYNNNTELDYWQPPEFLLKQLASPFATDNISSPSTMTLIFNSLASVSTYYANADPFFLTQATPNQGGLYSAGQEIATLICRDRVQLTIDSGTSRPSFLSTGTVSDVYKMWSSYRAMQPISQEVIDLDFDYMLLMAYLHPSIIWKSLLGLHGSLLDAQRSLMFPGIQIEVPENITARREQIRWLGVILLDVLYMANTLTGSDNNMGFGVLRFSDDVWFCGNTLRYTSTYVSIKLWDLFIIGLLVGGVTVVSYNLPKVLYRFIQTVKGQQDKWWRLIGAPLISFTLHDIMHLYRIALKGATGQDFIGTLSTMPVYKGTNKRDGGKAPYYGIVAWEYHRLLRGDKDPPPPGDVELQTVDNQATNDDASQNRSEISLLPNEGNDRATNDDVVSQNRSENSESPNEGSESVMTDDAVSPNRSKNSQLPNESVDDSATIATVLRRANEGSAGTHRSADSDLESDDVDDEVDAASEECPYVATMQRDPVRNRGDQLDHVQ